MAAWARWCRIPFTLPGTIANRLNLAFAGLSSQKHSLNLYLMGLYSDPDFLHWFVSEYLKYSKQKLYMGKSCVRFKKMDQIPYELIGKLMQKITVANWIEIYERRLKR